MYRITPYELTPDLTPGTRCGFCRGRIAPGESYCGQWCDDQDNGWWRSILVKTGPKDPMEGRGWLSTGSFD